MKKKKIIIVALVIVLMGFLALYFNFGFKNDNALTLEENKWIDENKYDVIDIALMNDIPILSYDGDGIIYEYLDYITDNHSLKFNIIPYKLNDAIEYNYTMNVASKVSEDDIKILEDNMVLITNTDIQYMNIDEITNLRIGILSSDKELVTSYLNNNISFVEYENYNALKDAIIDSKNKLQQGDQSFAIDAVIVLKTICTKEIIENQLNIAYQFNDLNQYFVLNIKDNKNLKGIINKTYSVWSNNNLNQLYNEQLLNSYYKFKNISDINQKKLKSKSYVYGFINYGIFDYLEENKISGINSLILKDFNSFSNLSITYTQYNSIIKLLDDFNSNKVDFVFDLPNKENFKTSIYETNNIYEKQLAVVSTINNNSIIENLKSLKNQNVLVVKDSYLEKILIDNNIKFKSYNNMKDLIRDFSSNDIIITDMDNYNFYKTTYFKNSKINYLMDCDDRYNYIINNSDSNKEFIELFDFYLSYNSIKELITKNYNLVAYNNTNITYMLFIIIALLVMYVVLDFSNHIKVMIRTVKKRKKINLSKEDKIKYIDQLTSLKNRNYLNSRIESWDDSEVYPKAIIVVDLNNISYINDNYGREEGDKVITEAANILIQRQIANSEIIRTDGNEFLIYLVGYTEKQIISYLRKLNKEFKTLSHGFGAASGYSIINDGIKTVDDAVNEATISMKENKEDIDY